MSWVESAQEASSGTLDLSAAADLLGVVAGIASLGAIVVEDATLKKRIVSSWCEGI